MPKSLAIYRRIYEIKPSANDARYLEALALLALGDFENGWRKHESRWYAHLGQPLRRVAPGPYWLGDSDLTGRTILVHAEQGHGDTVQFLRYIPLLRQQAARVILEVQPALKPMLAGLPDVYARGEDPPPYDTHCSFMSLPRAFRTMPDTIPAAVPYLTVPPDSLAKWRERLGPPPASPTEPRAAASVSPGPAQAPSGTGPFRCRCWNLCSNGRTANSTSSRPPWSPMTAPRWRVFPT